MLSVDSQNSLGQPEDCVGVCSLPLPQQGARPSGNSVIPSLRALTFNSEDENPLLLCKRVRCSCVIVNAMNLTSLFLIVP